MKRILPIFIIILFSINTYASESKLDLTGDVNLIWEYKTINNQPMKIGFKNSKADVDLTLDVSKKYENTKVGINLFLNPTSDTNEMITKITYNETEIPFDALNKQGPFTDSNGKQYWTYQTVDKSINLNAYGYMELDYKEIYIKAQTDHFTDHIDSNLLRGYEPSKSPGLTTIITSIPNSRLKISVNNGTENNANAIIQGEYFNSSYDITDLSGGFGVLMGDKEAYSAWVKTYFPGYNITLDAEYGIQKEASALGLFANYKGILVSNFSFLTQNQGFISANENTVIFGEKIKENNADEVILAAAYRIKGYHGNLITIDTTVNLVENIRLGLLLNSAAGDLYDEKMNLINDKFSYKVNLFSKLTEDLFLNFWYAGWGRKSITNIEGILSFNDHINLSAKYQIKELYDFEDVFTIQLKGKI